MGSHMINLFLCILSSLLSVFWTVLLLLQDPAPQMQDLTSTVLCLSVFMALLFWFKRESQHNGITIVFQLTIFLVILFFYSRHLL